MAARAGQGARRPASSGSSSALSWDRIRPASAVLITGPERFLADRASTLLREMLRAEDPSLEVSDLRSLSPVDYGPILDSVRKTGRAIVAQEAPQHASLGSEIAATIAERAFYSLEAPVLRVSGFDVPFPPAKLEGVYLPDADRILEAVDRSLAY